MLNIVRKAFLVLLLFLSFAFAASNSLNFASAAGNVPEGGKCDGISDCQAGYCDGGKCVPAATIIPQAKPPCTQDISMTGGCVSLPTALGDFFVVPTLFVSKIFGILIGVAGGIAVILIMIAGYRFMMSRGKPESIQQARDQLTAAIVGLIFLIFSLVILEVIGVDILHIPGVSTSNYPPPPPLTPIPGGDAACDAAHPGGSCLPPAVCRGQGNSAGGICGPGFTCCY